MKPQLDEFPIDKDIPRVQGGGRMKVALGPCPLCGGPATVESTQGIWGGDSPTLRIGCRDCQFWCRTEDTEKWEPGKGTFSIQACVMERMAARWNRRTTLTFKIEQEVV